MFLTKMVIFSKKAKSLITDNNGKVSILKVGLLAVGSIAVIVAVSLLLQPVLRAVLTIAFAIWVFKPTKTPVPKQYYWIEPLDSVILRGIHSVLSALELPVHVGLLNDMRLESIIKGGVGMYKTALDMDRNQIMYSGGLKKNTYKENADRIKKRANDLLMRRLENWDIENCTPSMYHPFPLFYIVHVEADEVMDKFVFFILPVTNELAVQYAKTHCPYNIQVNPDNPGWQNFMF